MSSISINDLPNEMIGEIFRQSDTVDKLYMREVCPNWNRVSEDLIPPHLIEALQQLNDIKVQADDAEKEVNALADRASRLETVQDNMDNLCVAAALASVGSAFIYSGSQAIEAMTEQMRKDIEANPAEYARRNEQCSIL